ncbi:MAG: S8 family peptidase, partial [Actinomycetota bacterium]|nr:S8 family peptidase [Actinomycetota bacterium]
MSTWTARALAPTVLLTVLALPGSAWAGGTSSSDDPPPPAHAAAVDPGLPTEGATEVDVVVRARPGADAAAAVRRVDGRPGRVLPLVDGVEAAVAADRLAGLAADPAVVSVTADRAGDLLGARGTAAHRGEPASGVPSYVASTGAAAAWTRGAKGRGVGIAVLDTGVSATPDLAGRLVYGPDLSGEGSPTDSHGHGTVMAGLAGGDGRESAGAHSGIAPEATVVSVKVAGRNGAVDVSTVLQAMHWVSAYADQYDIRVLNLSWGVPSTQDPAVDPLDYAVERLWEQGIVVVVGAGNAGPRRGTVTKPGDSPTVITVGALDDRGDTDRRNDTVPAWSSRGPTAQGVAKPDVVAPGRSLVATRSAGSAVEAENPDALVAPSYITGSGTSQAAAVTSGLAALLLSDRPHLSPDQVKELLVRTATKVPGAGRASAGAGRVALDRALVATPGPAVQQRLLATGLGSLEAARGGVHVEVDCGGVRTPVVGEVDARCQPWDARGWARSAWNGSAWNGSTWNGSAWNGSAWNGSAWNGSAWNGSAWNGSAW